MAQSKKINSRIVHKHDIEANWKLAVNFIPYQGEIIVYDADENYNYERFKIGDGVSNINNLPFKESAIESGKDKNSLISGTSTIFTEGDISFGENNSAGRKAFYIKAVDNTNKKIYLSTEQSNPPLVVTTDEERVGLEDTTFETPAYAVGDEFSILWGTHLNFLDNIAAIKNNVITWKSGDYTLSQPSKNSGDDAFTFHVPSKPHIGSVELGINAFSVGQDNKANGRGAFVAGRNNIVSGNYGFAAGRNNKAGYGVLVCGNGNTIKGNNSAGIGMNNTSSGQYAFTSGNKNTNGGYASIVGGENNTVRGGDSLVVGYQNTANNINYSSVLGGTNNVNGPYNSVLGWGNTANGQRISILGTTNNLSGNDNTAIGKNIVTEEDTHESVIVGKNNVPDSNARFIVANGTTPNARKNSLVIKKSGEIILNGPVIADDIKDTNGISYLKENLKIETQTYVGTGSASTSQSISYSFAPKLIIITHKSDGDNTLLVNCPILMSLVSDSAAFATHMKLTEAIDDDFSAAKEMYKTLDGKQLILTTPNAGGNSKLLNESGWIYYCVGIG